MKDWDLHKLAGGLWSSIRDWDYFQTDEIGQQVAKAAETILQSQTPQASTVIPIDDDPDEELSRPPSRQSIPIDDDEPPRPPLITPPPRNIPVQDDDDLFGDHLLRDDLLREPEPVAPSLPTMAMGASTPIPIDDDPQPELFTPPAPEPDQTPLAPQSELNPDQPGDPWANPDPLPETPMITTPLSHPHPGEMDLWEQEPVITPNPAMAEPLAWLDPDPLETPTPGSEPLLFADIKATEAADNGSFDWPEHHSPPFPSEQPEDQAVVEYTAIADTIPIVSFEESAAVADPFGGSDFLSLDELSLDELETFDNFLIQPEPSPPEPEPFSPPAETWEVETWEPEPEPAPTLRNPEGYQYFVTEAQDLLVTIEQELLALNETAATADIYSLMRATHTLKGAAANVGRDTIMTIAHNIEDVFRALLAPEAMIDQDVQGMLFEGYECLRLAMSAELAGEHSQDDELLNHAADIFARFQHKLGNCFDHQPPLPSSSEMGFDITQSIFEMGVQQRIEELETLIEQGGDELALAGLLQEQTEVFVGLGESLGLPTFTALSQTIQAAVMTSPEAIRAIAALALVDLKTAQRQVLAGDRTHGATLSQAWQPFIGSASPLAVPSIDPTPTEPPITPSEAIEEFERASTPDLISQPATPIPNSITLASDLWDDITTLTQEPDPTPIPNNPTPKPISKTLRIDLDQLEHLNHLVGELLINQNQLSLRDEQFQTSVQKLADWLRKHRLTLGQLRELLPQETNGEEVSTLHRLLYSALEETSQLTQATEDMNLLVRTTASTIEREKRLSKQLRDNMESARMMPIEGLLKRFPPMVKQLSMVHQKAVNLKIQGAGVLIDKTVTENLYDALLHLVRNAFDHGIEGPAERRSRGKPEEGQIEIAAYNQGNRTIIEVRDDGQGLNVGRILERAIAHQLITPTEAAQMRHSPELAERLLVLLCEPGFSTAAQVTDLSGRGVGLDVVKTQLAQIKGTLQVVDRGGQGTIFSIQIRESLLSARLLICRAGQSVYGFVSNEIEQVLIPGEKLRVLAGQKVLDWHQAEDEYTIPVYELGALFKSPPRLATSRLALAGNGELQPVLTTPQNIAPVLLLRTPDGLLGLEVEQVIEEQELVIKPISDAIAPPPYLYGCSILADGRLTLVIDGAMLVQYTQRNGMRQIQETPPPLALASTLIPPDLATETLGLYVPPSHPADAPISPLETLGEAPPIAKTTILVIDDSLTERQTLGLILKRAGQQVIEAKDGREALEILRSGRSVDGMICDIEMPRLNGLEFLSAVRQDLQWAKIPVVMLTSRSRDKFQAIALELGAYAYLTKPYVEQEILTTLTAALKAAGRQP